MAESEQSGSLFRDVFEAAPDPILVLDTDTTEILRANPASGAVLGLDREAVVGEQVAAFSPSEYSTEAARELIQQAVDRGRNEVEWSVHGPDGERRWIDVTLERATIDGETRVLAFVRDVTERRSRERRHRETNEQLRALLDNLPVVVFTLDPDGMITHSAGKGLDGIGLESGEYHGLSMYDVYGEYEAIVAALDRALAGEEVRITQRIDDVVFETWFRPVFDDGGSLSQVVGVARDITELKRREQQLEQLSGATLDLRYARDEHEVAGTVTDIVYRIIDRPIAAVWSPEEDADTLYPAGATEAATSFAGVDAASDLPPIEPGTAEMGIFDDGAVAVIEDYDRVDNPVLPDVPLGTLLCLPLGTNGLLCVGSDTVEPFDDTERFLLEILASTAAAALDRVQREAEMRAQRAELERSNEALQQFAYVASHDLQEPLRMVSSYVDLLETEYGDQFDAEAREYMHYATDGAARMKSMIDGLLSYSRVATQASSFEVIDATEVLETTLQELSLFLDERGTTVEYDVLPAVAADGAQLGQVFQNLLKNAADHGEASTVEVTATVREDDVEFAVADDGVGIPHRQHDRIFDIFQQGYDAGGGSGIGLAVCERIVHRHDGVIRLDSTPGDGTTFLFTIPRAEGETTDE